MTNVRNNGRRWSRAGILIVSGGCLLQVGSCGALIAPTILALTEQALFSALFSRLPIF